MELCSAIEAMGALAQENRLVALRLLVAAGATGLSAGTLADRLQLPASTASFHLSALERAGLIQSTRQGRQIVYAVRLAALRELIVFLTETCCEGQPELCGFSTVVPAIPEDHLFLSPAFNVLFLCTRNSARSIMAEAILQQVGRGRFNAYSAGADPAAGPMPEVLEKLRVLGHDVSGLQSKSWERFAGPDAPRMDFVIALCDTPESQVCPEFGDRVITGAWPLPDPAKFGGNKAERTVMLNELYSSLRRRIEIFTNLPFATLDRMALKSRLDEIGAGPTAALARSLER